MRLIAYMSEYKESDNDVNTDIDEIVATSKSRNPSLGITGVLFFHNGKFIQVIEGQEGSLRELLCDIEKDPRHCNIVYLVDVPVQSRGFKNWNMDSFNLSHVASLDTANFKKVWDVYKTNLIPRSDVFVNIYKSLMCDEEFQRAVAA